MAAKCKMRGQDMQINKVTLVYFSPTGTTQRTLRAIAEGMNCEIEEIDYTLPQNRVLPHTFTEQDFVLFGSPVYNGLAPLLVCSYLARVHGNNTPCAVVSVYGNRDFDDCLVELEDIVTENGFSVVAGGVFVGEHSFCPTIATNRPDSQDLTFAAEFGESIRAKMAYMDVLGPLKKGVLPGNRPYKTRGLRVKSPIFPETNNKCTHCMLCAELCPMGAISKEDPSIIEGMHCIRCMRCVRICPVHAKSFTNEDFMGLVSWCQMHFGEIHKEPDVFL